MIDSVEVLTSEMVRVSADSDALVFVGFIFLAFTLMLLWTFGECLKQKLGWILALICALGSIGLGFVAGKLFQSALHPIYEERYIVQLKENVPLDFIKNYEILEDKGNNIYIVREKGDE